MMNLEARKPKRCWISNGLLPRRRENCCRATSTSKMMDLPIPTPFPDIPTHIIQSKAIRFLLTYNTHCFCTNPLHSSHCYQHKYRNLSSGGIPTGSVGNTHLLPSKTFSKSSFSLLCPANITHSYHVDLLRK